MKKMILPFLALSLGFAVACNNTETKDSVEVAEEKNENVADTSKAGDQKEDDSEFMVEAASGGLMEVQLGEYALKNASAPQVKEFAKMMVNDHTLANNELKTLAARKNITIPSTPGEKHQDHINSMQNKKGADFDRDYMSMMVDDHEEDVKKFADASENAADPDVKAFAAKTLPKLRQHLEAAKSIKDKMK